MDLISRPEALKAYPALAQQILGWQAETLVLDYVNYEEGDEVYLKLDDEEATFLTAEMAETLNVEAKADLDRLIDPEVNQVTIAKSDNYVIAEPPGDTLQECLASAHKCLQALSSRIRTEEMVIMPMTRASILSQKNDYSEAANATSVLLSLGLPKQHEGAVCGSMSEMKDFVEPIFWIARCNACAPYVSFGFRDSPVVGTFCKYANIHFTTYGNVEERELQRDLKGSGFNVVDDGICRERFSSNGAIPGRRIQF